jgi:hypothetical protein
MTTTAMHAMTDAERRKFEREILALKLHGFDGECGLAAIEINRRIFGGEGRYIAGLNEYMLERGSPVGHAAVLYPAHRGYGRYWDARGEIRGGEEELRRWGVLNFEDPAFKDTPGWTRAHAAKAITVELGDEWVASKAFKIGSGSKPKMIFGKR